jgi:hypothetical protein
VLVPWRNKVSQHPTANTKNITNIASSILTAANSQEKDATTVSHCNVETSPPLTLGNSRSIEVPQVGLMAESKTDVPSSPHNPPSQALGQTGPEHGKVVVSAPQLPIQQQEKPPDSQDIILTGLSSIKDKKVLYEFLVENKIFATDKGFLPKDGQPSPWTKALLEKTNQKPLEFFNDQFLVFADENWKEQSTVEGKKRWLQQVINNSERYPSQSIINFLESRRIKVLEYFGLQEFEEFISEKQRSNDFTTFLSELRKTASAAIDELSDVTASLPSQEDMQTVEKGPFTFSTEKAKCWVTVKVEGGKTHLEIQHIL